MVIPGLKSADASGTSPAALGTLRRARGDLLPDPVDHPVEGSTTRRRLRVWRAVVLLCAVCAILSGIRSIHRWQMHRMADRVLEQVHRARDADRKDDVLKYLGWYVHLRPDDGEAAAWYALELAAVARTEGEELAAVLALEEVRRDQPERRDVGQKLVEIYVDSGRGNDALDHVREMLKLDPESPDLLLLQGRCYEAEARNDEAQKLYRNLIDSAPHTVPAYGRLVAILRRNPETYAEADTWLERMTEKNPDSASAWLERARDSRRRGAITEAAAEVLRAFSLAPDDRDVLSLLTAVLHAQSRTKHAPDPVIVETARRHLVAAVEKAPWNAELYIALAQIELAVENSGEALVWLERGQARERRPDLEMCLAEVLMLEGRLEEAVKQVDYLKRRSGDRLLVNFLGAQLELAQGRPLEAIRKLLPLRLAARLRGDVLLHVELSLSTCYRQIGHSAGALEAARRAAEIDMDSVESRAGLGAALEDEGFLEESVACYRTLNALPSGALGLARTLTSLNRSRPPAARQWDEVGQLLERLEADRPDDADVIVARARMFVAQDRLADALEYLSAANERNPDLVTLWVNRIAILLQLGETPQAESLLEIAEGSLGPRIEFRVARIQVAATEQNEDARERLEAFERGLDRLPPREQLEMHAALAIAWERLGQIEKAERQWEAVAALEPSDVGALRRLLTLAIHQSSDEKTNRWLGRLQEIEGPEGVYWRLGRVTAEIARAHAGGVIDLAALRAELESIMPLIPGAPAVPLALAELAELRNDSDAAADHYRDAIERGLRYPQVVIRAVRHLFARHRFVDAEQLLERYAEISYGGLRREGLGRIAAEAALHTHDYDQAMLRAREAVGEQPQDEWDCLWLAAVMEAGGNSAEAERLLCDARRRAPGEPGVSLAWVDWLVRKGRNPEAEAALSECAAQLVEPVASLTLARGSELTGNREAAKGHYERALEISPESAEVVLAAASYYLRQRQPDRSEPLWRRLLSGTVAENQSLTTAARRGLAACLLLRGTYRNVLEGLDLIRKNLPQIGGALEDQRLKARLLASLPGRRDAREAVSILANLAHHAILTPEDQQLLVALCIRVGDWPQARSELHALIAGRQVNADIAALGLREMLNREPTSTAVDLLLARLEQLEPTKARTVQMKARTLVRRDEFDEAHRLVMDSVATGAGAAADGERALLSAATAAALLAELSDQIASAGQREVAARFLRDADELYRAAMPREPARVPDYMMFLARRGRTGEALKLAESAGSGLAADEFISAIVGAMAFTKHDPALLKSARDLVARSVAEDPAAESDPRALYARGNFSHLLQEYGEAEQLYRRALDRQSDFVAAANDLAYLLTVHRHRPAEALELVRRALEIVGPQPWLLDTRAAALAELDRPEEALADLEQAFDDMPTPTIRFHLCQALISCQRRNDARNAFAEAVAAGLSAQRLHPLERRGWERLSKTFESR